MAQARVKKVKSLEETAAELKKSRQAAGYRGKQTIAEVTKPKRIPLAPKKKEITLGESGEKYGAFGRGTGTYKKTAKKPKKA